MSSYKGVGQRGDGQGKGMNKENQDTFFTLPNLQRGGSPSQGKVPFVFTDSPDWVAAHKKAYGYSNIVKVPQTGRFSRKSTACY